MTPPGTALSPALLELHFDGSQEPWILLWVLGLGLIWQCIRHVVPHILKHVTAMRFTQLTPEQARQGIEALRALNGHPEKEGDPE